jgi:hypothetical protein
MHFFVGCARRTAIRVVDFVGSSGVLLLQFDHGFFDAFLDIVGDFFVDLFCIVSLLVMMSC